MCPFHCIKSYLGSFTPLKKSDFKLDLKLKPNHPIPFTKSQVNVNLAKLTLNKSLIDDA